MRMGASILKASALAAAVFAVAWSTDADSTAGKLFADAAKEVVKRTSDAVYAPYRF